MRSRSRNAAAGALALALVAAGVAVWLLPSHRAIAEQTDFSEDEDLQKPIALPPETLNVLLKLDSIVDAMDSASESEKRNPSLLFTRQKFISGAHAKLIS